MNWFRVTKYDPDLRGSEAFFSGEDAWTAFSDVGKEFGGKRLEISTYLEVENAYIDFYLRLLELLPVQHFILVDVEVYEEEGRYWVDRQEVFLGEIKPFMQAVLRDQVWGKLIGADEVEIHFGYDFYTYFGVKTDIDVGKSEERLFVERIDKSPYC